mmetsp:Transcript_102038/g.288120  ORF Transcript_102038/g.288120 Transcript_102038/m.288120 type:complete len:214 (-) Transcript_102038:513-1154(-)
MLNDPQGNSHDEHHAHLRHLHDDRVPARQGVEDVEGKQPRDEPGGATRDPRAPLPVAEVRAEDGGEAEDPKKGSEEEEPGQRRQAEPLELVLQEVAGALPVEARWREVTRNEKEEVHEVALVQGANPIHEHVLESVAGATRRGNSARADVPAHVDVEGVPVLLFEGAIDVVENDEEGHEDLNRVQVDSACRRPARTSRRRRATGQRRLGGHAA